VLAANRIDQGCLDGGMLTAALDLALTQLQANLPRFATLFPHDTTNRGVYPLRQEEDAPLGANVGWTTGFWTGMLWIAYELTGRDEFRAAASDQLASYAERIDRRIGIDHHDLGFLYTPSCVAAWRTCADGRAYETALRAADCLMQRYLPAAGILQAWGNRNDPDNRGRVIIDCLLNLPLLRWAHAETGDEKYLDVMRSHLCQSRDFLVRKDASSFHTYYFDVDSGHPLRGSTAQGANDESCWARGQAWGIYGFALNHRYAPDLGLIDVALRMSDYFLSHLPTDGIAYWDLAFREGIAEPRDSSATVIAVCGMLELSSQLAPSEQRETLQRKAFELLAQVVALCAAKPPQSNALLLHGVYSKPHGQGIDEANLWGDYFYLEALARTTRRFTPHWH
jgi:unsaturated chondroitin disaccharide hydrolase